MHAVLSELLCSICHRRIWRITKGAYSFWLCARCDL